MSDMVEQYKAYLQDLQNIGLRHETARNFYITLLSGMLSFLALTGKEGPLTEFGHPLVIVVGIGGIAICVLWLFHTLAFTALYSAKFGRLKEMETNLPFQNFMAEHAALKANRRYHPLTYVEYLVTVVFGLLFIVTIGLVSAEQTQHPGNNESWLSKLFADPVASFTGLLVVATVGLWGATYKLVWNAEKTAQRQLRAYVTAKQITIQNEKPKDRVVHIVVHNFGQTPASNCSYWINVCAVEWPLVSKLTKPELTEDSRIGVIAPTDEFIIRVEVPSLFANSDEIHGGHSAMYVYGQFHYTDAFGMRQTTNFRFMRKGEGWTKGGEMETCPDGNDAT